MQVAVGDRRFHAQHHQAITGLEVGEGQACILLGDLQTYQAQLAQEAGHDSHASTAARLWVIESRDADEAVPTDSAAKIAVVEVPTAPFAVLDIDDAP